MPEGYDQLTKQFFHTERVIGFGLDMVSAPRDVPEGATPRCDAVLFSGGNIVPAKLANEAVVLAVLPGDLDEFSYGIETGIVQHGAVFNTRFSTFVLLMTPTSVCVLSSSGCHYLMGEPVTYIGGGTEEFWFGDEVWNEVAGIYGAQRWEGYMMMQGTNPVIVINDDGIDAPYYWDGKANCLKPCSPLMLEGFIET